MPDTLKKGGSEGPSGSQHSRWNDPRLRQRLGALDVSVGFQTEEAEDLAAQDGEHRLAAQLVNCAEIGDAIAGGEATQQIATILRSAQQQSSGSAALGESSHATYAGEEWLPPERRCGKPFDDDELDRHSLFCQ
jgi:hypothetical protein